MTVLLQIVVVGAITGVAAVILGGVLGFSVLPDALEDKLTKHVRLELSEAYKQWATPPFDVTTKIYFFDVKNPKDIINGENAILEEKGPIIFKQTRTKENIHYNRKLDTFTYDEMITHVYDKDSPLKETDSIYTLNILKYMSLGYCKEMNLLEKLKNKFQSLFEDLPNNDIFHPITIRDFLITGYECLPDTSSDAQMLKTLILSKLKNNPRFQKTKKGFNFFAFRPEQSYKENTYEMQGGAKSLSSQGKLISVNGTESLNIWPDTNENYCNSIQGTDPFTISPEFKVNHGLLTYDNDLCRIIHYSTEDEVEVGDFSGVRMILKPDNFEYLEEGNNNQCFCIENDGNCTENGFLNLERCIQGIPWLASQPHFLYTDLDHSKKLNFQPNIKEDVSFIDIEKDSGTVLQLSKKTQYNIWIQNFEGFSDNVKPFMLPIFWIEEYMEIPSDTVNKLNEIYFDELYMIEGVKWGLLGVGAGLILLSIGVCLLSTLKLGSQR